MLNFFDLIPVHYYSSIYFIGIFILCLFVCFNYSASDNSTHIVKEVPVSSVFTVSFVVAIILFIGLRPISWEFIDMRMYAHTYNNILDGTNDDVAYKGEWLFYTIANLCKKLGLDDRYFFLVIATLYFGLMAIACWRLMRNNFFVAILFCLISFSCFSYGTNGIRSGMASSFLMLAITFLNRDNKIHVAFAIALMFASYSIHRSMFLPAFCAIISFIWNIQPKYAIVFWIISIFISLVAGNLITNFFVSLGFDDRMEQYANLDEYGEIIDSKTYKTGFRVDFIIYSIAPIIMAWYVTIKRNFKDEMYNIIASTYILSNSFWIMVIRSEQSNRFAYLSWFLYPIVIAYPLLRMNIWRDQDRKLALILFLYSGFTFFMEFIYYG